MYMIKKIPAMSFNSNMSKHMILTNQVSYENNQSKDQDLLMQNGSNSITIHLK